MIRSLTVDYVHGYAGYPHRKFMTHVRQRSRRCIGEVLSLAGAASLPGYRAAEQGTAGRAGEWAEDESAAQQAQSQGGSGRYHTSAESGS